MKAKIKPLYGKYYGTQVEITASCGEVAVITLWSENYDPSDREINDKIGCSKEEWARNDEVFDGFEWGSAKQMHEFIFPHCENQQDLDLARLIVGQINTEKPTKKA